MERINQIGSSFFTPTTELKHAEQTGEVTNQTGEVSLYLRTKNSDKNQKKKMKHVAFMAMSD